MLLVATTTGMIPLVVTAAIMFGFGLLRSLQFSALNTMVYADVLSSRTSRATSLADTLKQLWQGVGVSVSAILLRGLDVEFGQASGPRSQQIAIILMAGVGILAISIFRKLASDAGAAVSGHSRHAIAET